MTAFPEPIDPPQTEPSEGDVESALTTARQRVKDAADPAAIAELLDAFESETVQAAWSPLLSAMVSADASSEVFTAGVRRLKAVAVLDPSDKKRAAALEALVALPVDRAPDWIAEFARERMLSDESNYTRATAASAVVCGGGDAKLFEFAAQWLRHTGIEPLGTPAPGWANTVVDEAFFARERRALLADELAVQTLRSRAKNAADAGAAGPGRRGGPTLVQGHHSHAGPLIVAQRVAAVGLGGYGVYALAQGQAGLGAALLAGAVAWLAALQVWKWYKYG